MKRISKEEVFLILRTLVMMFIGSCIYSLGVDLFYRPAQLLSGGITGLALLLNYTFGLNSSVLIVALNLPMFILGWFFVSKRFVIFSLIGMGMLSGTLELFSGLSLPFTNPLTSVVLGGVLVGAGLGIVLRTGYTMGGTDIIGKILHRFLSVNMAVTDLTINACILVFAAFFKGIDQAVLTICAMYIATQVTSFWIDGIDHRRALFIVTNKQEELSDALMQQLGRGVTVLDTYGAFTHQHNSMLYCVIPKQQLSSLKRIIRSVDEHAFFTIIPVTGVYGHGRGFVPMEKIDK